MKHLTHVILPLGRSIIEKANSKPLFQICQVSLSRVCFSLTERGEKKIRGWIRNILAPYLKKRNDVIKKLYDYGFGGISSPLGNEIFQLMLFIKLE